VTIIGKTLPQFCHPALRLIRCYQHLPWKVSSKSWLANIYPFLRLLTSFVCPYDSFVSQFVLYRRRKVVSREDKMENLLLNGASSVSWMGVCYIAPRSSRKTSVALASNASLLPTNYINLSDFHPIMSFSICTSLSSFFKIYIKS
jgi:hypothetical protein